ncbi:MAG TPA: GNAT family N-acetyltransferase [Chthonomonadaceae bacterium]|nr:GNAT family N-acetyltransferase [Chthonomonadaceae bacterium]
MISPFASERLHICTLRALPPEQKAAFYAWIESLTPEADNEQGVGPDGFAAWLRLHEPIPGDTTYVFTDRETGALLGTASLVKRDRETEAEPGGWVIGGVNVVGARRQQGIGTAIMRFLEAALQHQAEAENRAIPVKLVATYAPAIRLYERFGFTKVPGSRDEYAKTYLPEMRRGG